MIAQKLPGYVGSFVILFILSSCATMVRGTKQKVTFTSNVDTISIKVNDDQVIKPGESIRVWRTEKQSIRVDAAGYEPISFDMHRGMHPAVALNTVFFTDGLVTGVLILAPGDRTNNDVLIPIGLYTAWFSFLFPEFFGGIDLALGGGIQMEKDIHLQMHKYTEPLESRPIRIGTVKVNGRGQGIGYNYSRIGNSKEAYIIQPGAGITGVREKAVYLIDEEVAVQINSLRMKYGCDVPAEVVNTLGGDKETLILNASLRKIENNTTHKKGVAITKGELTILWTLKDAFTNKTVLEIETHSEGIVRLDGGPTGVLKAIDHATYQLIDDPRFRKAVGIK